MAPRLRTLERKRRQLQARKLRLQQKRARSA
jgi:hypothetical protein